eukprot:366017-Chlamydomonas_euryale.AAC.11
MAGSKDVAGLAAAGVTALAATGVTELRGQHNATRARLKSDCRQVMRDNQAMCNHHGNHSCFTSISGTAAHAYWGNTAGMPCVQ